MNKQENKKDITKHEVMSEFLKDCVLIVSKDSWTALPINEHIEIHYYKGLEPQYIKISFNQIIDLVHQNASKI